MKCSLIKAISLMIILLFMAGCAAPAPTTKKTFSGHRFWYDPVYGKVGHHLSVGTPSLSRYKGTTSRERGCRWGKVSEVVSGATCTRDLVISGSFPPGIQFESCYDLNISGTPQQPGDWVVTIRLPPFYCPEGVSPTQDVSIRFHIKGIAPRRIKR